VVRGERHEGGAAERPAALVGLFAGPTGLIFAQEGAYALAPRACATGNTFALQATALAGLIVVGLGAWLAWRGWRDTGAGGPTDTPDPKLARARFLSAMGLLAAPCSPSWSSPSGSSSPSSIHAVALWAWHTPPLYRAALHSGWVHAAQHVTFTLSAVLFWWVLARGAQRPAGHGAGVLYLFATTLHTGLLGALLAVAPTVWYPEYLATTAPWGLTPLEDQQLGGLIMWVPACSVYVAAGLALFAAWLRAGDRTPAYLAAAPAGGPT